MEKNLNKKIIIVLITMIISFYCNAQSERSQFIFNSSNGSIGSNIKKTDDGGLLLIGSSGDNNNQNSDMIIIKTDANKNTVWSKTYKTPNYYSTPYNWYWWWGQYGGTFSCEYSLTRLDYAIDAVEVNDGFVILGCYDRFTSAWPNCAQNNFGLQSMFNYVLIKISKTTGNILWTKKYGDFTNNIQYGINQVPTSIQKTKDEGFIISGYTHPGNFLDMNNPAQPQFTKLDKNGNVKWSKIQYGGGFQYMAGLISAGFKFPIIELQDGGYAYAASTGFETYLVKLDTLGNTVWSKKFGYGDGNAGYLAPYSEQQFAVLAFGVGYITLGFVPCLKEVLTGDDKGNLVLVGNGSFTLATALGLLFNSGGSEFNGGASSYGLNIQVGLVLETNSTGTPLRNSIFNHPTGNVSGNVSDVVVTDLDILPDNTLLITGGTYYSSYLLNYNRLGTTHNSHIIWSKILDSYYYNSALIAYDFPSTLVDGNNAISLVDNFKLSETPIVAPNDSCYQTHYFNSDNFGFPTAGNEVVQLINTSFPVASLSMIATNLITTRQINCNASPASSSRKAKSTSEYKQIQTNTKILDLKLYPNPTNRDNAFTVSWKSENENNYSIFIFNVNGEIIMQENGINNFGLNEHNISANLPNGMYFVRLQSNGHVLTSKLIKQ